MSLLFFCVFELRRQGRSRLLQFALGPLRAFPKLACFLFKPLAPLAPHVAAGRAIPNLDFRRFECRLTPVRLGLPVIAALEELGQENANRSAEGLPNFRHRDVAFHGRDLQEQTRNRNRSELTPPEKTCQGRVALSLVPPPPLSPAPALA